MNLEKHSFHWALGGSDTSGGIEQNQQELLMLCDFIKQNEIKTFLEIGMGSGLLNKFMRDEMLLDCEGINPVNVQGVTYLGKSQDAAIINAVKDSYDLIFVDGDHSYSAVRNDFLKYGSKCKFLAFHDILGKRNCEDVNRFWNEVKFGFEYYEFVAENKDQASGIGLIKLK